jgi:hypothetical protein
MAQLHRATEYYLADNFIVHSIENTDLPYIFKGEELMEMRKRSGEKLEIDSRMDIASVAVTDTMQTFENYLHTYTKFLTRRVLAKNKLRTPLTNYVLAGYAPIVVAPLCIGNLAHDTLGSRLTDLKIHTVILSARNLNGNVITSDVMLDEVWYSRADMARKLRCDILDTKPLQLLRRLLR